MVPIFLLRVFHLKTLNYSVLCKIYLRAKKSSTLLYNKRNEKEEKNVRIARFSLYVQINPFELVEKNMVK